MAPDKSCIKSSLVGKGWSPWFLNLFCSFMLLDDFTHPILGDIKNSRTKLLQGTKYNDTPLPTYEKCLKITKWFYFCEFCGQICELDTVSSCMKIPLLSGSQNTGLGTLFSSNYNSVLSLTTHCRKTPETWNGQKH